MSTPTRVRLLRGSGLLLLLLGIVHLVATPHIAALIRHSASQGAADNPDRWAQVIVRTTAVTVATLPLTLLALMGVRYFDAPLFVVGFLLVVAASVTLLLAAFTRPRTADSADTARS